MTVVSVGHGVTSNGGLTITNGTTYVVVSGGLLENEIVQTGGTAVVSSGGFLSAMTVSSGGLMTVGSGGTDTASTVYAGGTVVLAKGADASLAVNGGTLYISGAGTATAVSIAQGGTVDLASPAAAVGGTLTFNGTGTLLVAATPSTGGDAAVISGFATGDYIDITKATAVGTNGTVGVSTAVYYNSVANTTTLDVISSTSTLVYTFAGNVASSSFAMGTDTAGNIKIGSTANFVVPVSAGQTSTGLIVNAGTLLNVLAGGVANTTTVANGGTLVIQSGATASATTIQTGGVETVLGTQSGGTIGGTQVVSGANAVISNETIAGGTLGIIGAGPEQGILGAGVVDLDIEQSAASGLVVSGGVLVLSGSTSATNVTIENVGTVTLASGNAALSGNLTFAGGGRIVVGANAAAGAGVQGVISGFGLNDAIELTSATAIGAAFNAGNGTLTTAASGGNTVVTVSGGGSSESFTLAGGVAVSAITDAAGGMDIVTLPTITAFTAGDLVVSIEGDASGGYMVADDQASPVYLEELTTTGSIVGIMVLPQFTKVINGVTQYAISGEFGSQSELSLQLSGDGQSLTVMGYGANARAYENNQSAYGSPTFAQTYDTTNSGYTAVPRIVADIGYNGSVDTSTALYNVYNQNNPRSAYTINGSQFWVSGQGTGNADGSQGVYFTQDGANSASVISQAAETRMVTVYNGQLYVSRDDKSVGGGSILDYGTDPTSATTGTALAGITNSVTLTATNGNGLYAAGTVAYLSPENYFFASPTVLYIADGGAPKDSAGSEKIGTLPTIGGLQKWVLNTVTNTWSLAYTLSAGLNLVSQDNTVDGTSGLLGLTGTVNATTGAVTFYATNYVLSDFDPTYLYTITDNINNTAAQAAGETFTQLLAGVSASFNVRGISFAPTSDGATGSATVVGSSVSSSGVTVTSGGSISIQNGGTAVATSVEAGGTETVAAGGVASASDIVNGATDTVFGSASGDYLGGAQTVSGGSIAFETILNGGFATVSASVASGVTVETGGTLLLGGGATAVATVLQGGVVDLATADATLSGTVAFTSFGGTIDVATLPNAGAGIPAIVTGWGAGSTIDFQGIGTGATLTIGTAAGNTVATISSGSVAETITFAGLAPSQLLQLVPDGGTGEDLTYQAPPTIVVPNGVTSTGLNVYVGTVDVLAGGTLSNGAIFSGASGVIQYGGLDQNSTVYAGGFESVNGNATGDQIYGTQMLSATSSATISGETVYTGGAIDLFLAGTSGTNLTAISGGQLNINGRGTIDNAILNGGTIQLESPKATLSGSITFEAQSELIYTARNSQTSGSLFFGDQAVISGFVGGDVIDLTSAVGIGAAATLATTFAGGVTTATIGGDGGIAQTFMFNGNLTGGLQLTSDGAGGVEITTLCFLPGTEIATPGGVKLIEDLKAGDIVRTWSGGARPITWIGTGRVLAARGRRNAATPITVRRGAIADNVPARDLQVTKGHSLFIDGVLIPVEFLVNHRTILWDDHAQEVRVFHVELDAHDILIANGAPAESYRDDGNRWLFQNANPGWNLPEKPHYAPVLTGGPIVDTVWRRILDRAGLRFIPMTEDPDVHIVADGKRIDAATAQDGLYVFRLPDMPASLAIASRDGVPSEMGIARDFRSLGIGVRKIVVRQDTRFKTIAARDEHLTDGFHAYEPDSDIRWTKGMGVLPAQVLPAFRGAVEVVVTVAATAYYPDEGKPAAA